MINEGSNRLLRLLGLTPDDLHDGIQDVSELRQIVATAAQAGHISTGQSQLAQNVLGIMNMEARHILVPRPDVQYLSLERTFAENLAAIHDGGHSRYPLCEHDLDSVVGIVHTRDLVRMLPTEAEPTRDLRTIARDVVFVPETQPLSRVIVTMQNTRNHLVVVVDEHGSSVGLAFLEDALEEIVGPLADEFDVEQPLFTKLDDGAFRVAGNVALPKAVELLGLADIRADVEPETIAGMVTSELGRLPKAGDRVRIEHFDVNIESMSGRRIQWLKFAPRSTSAPASVDDDTEA